MNIVSMWSAMKTGTSVWAIVGGVGLLLAGLALAGTGQLSWTEYGVAAWTIVTGLFTLIRARFAIMKSDAKNDAILSKLPR